MGFLRRKLRQRVEQQDADRWRGVERLLEPGETRIEYTPCRFLFSDGVEEAGYFYLTDRAVLLERPSLPNPLGRVDLQEIERVTPSGDGTFWLGARNRRGDRWRIDVEFYPSPISDGLYDELLDRVGADSA